MAPACTIHTFDPTLPAEAEARMQQLVQRGVLNFHSVGATPTHPLASRTLDNIDAPRTLARAHTTGHTDLPTGLAARESMLTLRKYSDSKSSRHCESGRLTAKQRRALRCLHVPAKPLLRLMDERGVQWISYLKIDCEVCLQYPLPPAFRCIFWRARAWGRMLSPSPPSPPSPTGLRIRISHTIPQRVHAYIRASASHPAPDRSARDASVPLSS